MRPSGRVKRRSYRGLDPTEADRMREWVRWNSFDDEEKFLDRCIWGHPDDKPIATMIVVTKRIPRPWL